jgi:hypothetical protein
MRPANGTPFALGSPPGFFGGLEAVAQGIRRIKAILE